MHVERQTLTTPDGWTLTLHRGTVPGKTPGPPVLFVPGFGMNAFIFRYHPRGGSFMEYLLEQGFDPWSVDLRGQSTSTPPKHNRGWGLADHAFVDLPATFRWISRFTGYERVHAIGCSLGGALLYGYGGTIADHRIDRLVTMGSPLRWTTASGIVAAFGTLAPVFGKVPVQGTRHLARWLLPVGVRLVPGLMAVYLNPRLTHTGEPHQLSRTVEDTHPAVNLELARWIRNRDLTLGGIDVADALRKFDRPLLVVVGNGDRICPPEVALSAVGLSAGPSRALKVGTDSERVAHADLFISDLAPERIYAPIARFLREGD